METKRIRPAGNRETLIKQQLKHSACDGRRGCGEECDDPMAIEIRDERRAWPLLRARVAFSMYGRTDTITHADADTNTNF